MPKTAATMTGLVLAACSIGYNSVRYPIVSEMIGPALASAPAALPAQSEPPAPADVPSAAGDTKGGTDCQPAAAAADGPSAPRPRIEVKPVPDVAGAIAEPAAALADPAGKAATATDDGAAAAPASPEKPLVPVSPAAVSAPAAAGDYSGAVRRLPPVDRNLPATSRVWPPDGGPIPVYPSTGIK